MIDISHVQAQRLIRETVDRALPDEQWSALQAHLEGCTDCRAYREARLELVKRTRRALGARWAETGGHLAQADVAGRVIAARGARAHRRQLTGRAALIVSILVILVGYINYRREHPPAAPPATALPVAVQTVVPTATATALPFQGVVAFEAPRASQIDSASRSASDIFLLSAGPSGAEITNLTNHPSHNSDPVWSPDGQWLAFLSDRQPQDHPRAGAGNDIYVMSIAGTRLTRLTGDSSITWQGPLSWSGDGQWLAAVGMRQVGAASQKWLYLIPINGDPPEPLVQGASLPKFSPLHPWLAFAVTDSGGTNLTVYDYVNRTTLSITGGSTWPVIGQLYGQLYTGEDIQQVDAFDWSEDGRTLMYITQSLQSGVGGPSPMLDVHEAIDLEADFSGAQYVYFTRTDPINLHLIRRIGKMTPLRFATWSPFGDFLYVPYPLIPGAAGPCANTLLAWEADPGSSSRQLPKLNLPTLCLTHGLERSNWVTGGSPGRTGDWLVVGAHRLTEAVPGVYALHIPDPVEPARSAALVRLADLPAGAGALQVKPERSGLSGAGPEQIIDPHPARPPALAPPQGLLSSVLVVRRLPEQSYLARLSADGSRSVPLEGGKLGFCARSSPDGQQVAFASLRGTIPDRSDLFIAGASGQNTTQITRLPDIPVTSGMGVHTAMAPRFECPVWSPDGTRLAAWVQTSQGNFLAILPASGDSASARYLPLVAAGNRVPPRWTPDSREVVLSVVSPGQRKAEILAVDAASGQTRVAAASDGWDQLEDAVFSPDGTRFAYLAHLPGAAVTAEGAAEGAPAGADGVQLRIDRLTGGAALQPSQAPGVTLPSEGQYRFLSWLGSGEEAALGLVHQSMGYRNLSTLLVYQPAAKKLSTLAAPEEPVLSVGWSADGEWVLYSTQSGLYALNIPGALAGTASPAKLNDQAVDEIDWR